MADHEQLLAMASAETGLDDFGEASFLEGLEILTRSLKEEARLNAMGEIAVRRRIVEYLKQRLQVEEWYRRHPEIDAEPITAPLIGMSLPRTGSTALSFLLAQDPEARSLRRWEAAQPCPPPSTVTGNDPRIAQAEAVERQGKSHTPAGATGPAECLDLMALDFKSQYFQALAQIPSYSAWLVDADLAATYRYERRVLKLLQWGCPTRPWRLKCPTHLIFLEALDSVFPDARYVMTHRDPADVMLSTAAVYADIIGRFTDHVDRRYVGQLCVGQWSLGMQRTLAYRQRVGDARFFDIDFTAMHRDPIGEVRRLYRWLGEPLRPAFVEGMEHWWQHNSANREPAAKADPADFGLDLAQVRNEFADYTAQMAQWTQR